MKDICDVFIKGLEAKYLDSNDKLNAYYKSFSERKKGISNEKLEDLLKEFPNIPVSLLELLKYSDGIDIYCFQSDVDDGKYPYYLINSFEMLAEKDIAKNYYADYISRYFDDVEVDNRITNNIDNVKWLLFSNCMNNGGTSQLFIDFTPSKKGKVGQIIRYLHDPDSIVVIADNFDDFLKQIIDTDYKFIDDGMIINDELCNNTLIKLKTSDDNKERKLQKKMFKPIFCGIILMSLINFFYVLISILNYDTINLLYMILLMTLSLLPLFLALSALLIKKNNKMLRLFYEIIKILLMFISFTYLININYVNIILLLLNIILIVVLFIKDKTQEK